MSLTCSTRSLKSTLKNNIWMLATLLAVVVGTTLGVGLRPFNLSPDVITWLGLWGELFFRMLKMISLPLIPCCIILGIGSMEGTSSGKLGLITFIYIFSTQLIVCILGAVLVASIRPGQGFGDVLPDAINEQHTSYTDVFADLIRNLVPDNIIQACTQSVYTHREQHLNTSHNTTQVSSETKKQLYRDRTNIMGIVTVSIALGISICFSGESGRPLYNVFESLNHVLFKLMKAIIWYSPIGILSLTAKALLEVEDLQKASQALGLFVGTIVGGCLIHQFVILPLIYLIVCRRNPFKYIFAIFDGYVAGFASASSAVAMPYLLRDCTEKLGIDRRVAQCVIPVQVTINKDGSALFIYVTVVFLAQCYSIPMGLGQYIMLVFFITILVGAVAVTPSASIVVVIMVSSAIGVPVQNHLGLIMSVEWINDHIRTGTNVISHAFGCAIAESIYRKFDNTTEDTDVNEDKTGDNTESSLVTNC